MKKSRYSMKADYQKYLQSAHWQEFRRKVIIDAGNICEKCDIPRWLASIAYDQDLHVHHLSYENLGHEEYTDVQVLCRRCHDIETYGRSDFRSPKKATCDFCMDDHWDVYSPFCPVCQSIFGITEPISSRFGYTDPRDKNNSHIWESVVEELLLFFKNDGVPTHEVMSVVAKNLKKISDLDHRKKDIADFNEDDDIPF